MKIFPKDPILVDDMASGIWNSATSMGNFLGPLVGSILISEYTFRTFVNWCGMILIVYLLFYISIGSGKRAFKMHNANANKLAQVHHI